MGITIKKHRRNLSYDDAATLSEFWVIAKQFDRSLYREWKDHWDERGFNEYIVVTEGHLPYLPVPLSVPSCWDKRPEPHRPIPQILVPPGERRSSTH